MENSITKESLINTGGIEIQNENHEFYIWFSKLTKNFVFQFNGKAIHGYKSFIMFKKKTNEFLTKYSINQIK